jgi:hypothetical protein
MASAWYSGPSVTGKILGSGLARGTEWFTFPGISIGYMTKLSPVRTIANQAELPSENYESGGQEFESLRARQHLTEIPKLSPLTTDGASIRLRHGSNTEAAANLFAIVQP